MLDVYLHEAFVGRLIQDDGGQTVFQYAEAWLARPGATALSVSLPLRKERFIPSGIYEKIAGTKIYWIRFADSTGKIRRERLVLPLAKWRTETLQGRKLPETLRIRQIRFDELAKDALEYSKNNNAK
jgi:hypothetical protein